MKMKVFCNTPFATLIIFALICGTQLLSLDHQKENKFSRNENSVELRSNQGSCNAECLYQWPVDCAEILENGHTESGVYDIYPKSRIISCKVLSVYCDMKTDGGGWTVIQRRGDFKRPADYFYRNWDQYKTGFGSLQKDFWLGNNNIHGLTNQKKYSVRFDLGVGNETAFALYDEFWIDNEDLKYKIHIKGYSGTAGDSMEFHNNMGFSTKDQTNSIDEWDCARLRKGAWWYANCSQVSLNGLYVATINNYDITRWEHYYWNDFKGAGILDTAEIKIRPYDF